MGVSGCWLAESGLPYVPEAGIRREFVRVRVRVRVCRQIDHVCRQTTTTTTIGVVIVIAIAVLIAS